MYRMLPNDRNAIVLTFDDGPVPGQTPRILEILQAKQARATFYVLGELAEAHPDLVRDIRDAGHEVGNHTQTHPHFRDADPQLIDREMRQAQDVLTRILASHPSTFRPPYFDYNEHVARTATDLGLPVIGNSIFPGDWVENATPDELRETASSDTKAGDILLFHDRSAAMVEGLPLILDDLIERGLSFATAADLVQTAMQEPAP
ncbi:MAG: polysaccharide deacetylase family protein [Planctomycetes bacterium]|jgi:peptidoglycan/xylan/chitin deacetylase (PgdA/CDA1 family)|nr:polysaccharide deacetylase family protein [Planctomycetota bacterium]